jgi:hypothetical protein
MSKYIKELQEICLNFRSNPKQYVSKLKEILPQEYKAKALVYGLLDESLEVKDYKAALEVASVVKDNWKYYRPSAEGNFYVGVEVEGEVIVFATLKEGVLKNPPEKINLQNAVVVSEPPKPTNNIKLKLWSNKGKWWIIAAAVHRSMLESVYKAEDIKRLRVMGWKQRAYVLVSEAFDSRNEAAEKLQSMLSPTA